MDFIAFLLVNALLFIRPQEIAPELEKVPLYYFAVLTCLCFSISSLIKVAFEGPILKHPTVVLSLLMLFFAGISLAANRELGIAVEEEFEFVKIMVYFGLFLAIVRTPGRLKGVIACVIACMTVTAIMGILNFYGIIELGVKIQETLVANRETWTEEALRRLRFSGILHDPNEVAIFLGMLTFLCAFYLTDKRAGAARLLWLFPMAVFLFSIYLTRSRGGLLSLFAGMGVFAVYGFRKNDVSAALTGASRPPRVPVKGLLFLGLCVPLLLFAYGGRQTDVSGDSTTVETRFGLWSDWLQEFRGSPLIGIGPNVISQEMIAQATGNFEYTGKHCAHNSYLQPFADLGFFGGICFLGAVGFALLTMHRFAYGSTFIYNTDLSRLQPYLMASLSCFAVGFLTLTLNYILPTFFVLALPVAYYGMTPCYPPIKRPSLSIESIAWLGVAGVGFLAFTYVTVMVMPKQ